MQRAQVLRAAGGEWLPRAVAGPLPGPAYLPATGGRGQTGAATDSWSHGAGRPSATLGEWRWSMGRGRESGDSGWPVTFPLVPDRREAGINGTAADCEPLPARACLALDATQHLYPPAQPQQPGLGAQGPTSLTMALLQNSAGVGGRMPFLGCREGRKEGSLETSSLPSSLRPGPLSHDIPRPLHGWDLL